MQVAIATFLILDIISSQAPGHTLDRRQNLAHYAANLLMLHDPLDAGTAPSVAKVSRDPGQSGEVIVQVPGIFRLSQFARIHKNTP
jgi:hypothetical protein